MKKCQHCKCEKELSQFGPNRSFKDGLAHYCKPCQREASKKTKARHPEYIKAMNQMPHIKAMKAAYKKTPIGKLKEKEYRDRDLVRESKRHKKYYENNKEKITKYVLLHRSKWPHKHAAIEARRRAAKFQRTPKWLTNSDWIEIKWAYKIAADMTKKYKKDFHVDHIIPLQGKNISGLHCPQNLQIIPGRLNESKGNRL